MRRRSSIIPDAVNKLRLLSPDEHALAAAGRILDDCLLAVPEAPILMATEDEHAELAAAILIACDERDLECDPVFITRESSVDDAFLGRMRVRVGRYPRSILLCSYRIDRRLRAIFTEIGTTQRRHAHLLGINEAMLKQGLRADYREVERNGAMLLEKLGTTSVIRVQSPAGTELVARPDPRGVWHNQSGILHSPGWTNLPAGEVVTCPLTVDGVFVPDGGLYLTDGTAIDKAEAKRLKVHFEMGRVAEAEGPPDLVERLITHLDSGIDGRRVGQIGFGTNTGVLAPIGLVAQDSKLPGFHLTLSYTAAQCTGASWCGNLLVNLLQRRADVWIDSEAVLSGGRFVGF
ncbi:MAG: hypothetical protein AB7S26_26685 [Sandaracinaceae bacterium]